jgi:hypothetical protein
MKRAIVIHPHRSTNRTGRVVAMVGGIIAIGIGAALTIGAASAPATGPAASSSAASSSAVSATVSMQQVMSEYVRATDHRDGSALAALFTPDGSVNILAPEAAGGYRPVTDPIVGRAAIADAVSHAQAPLPALGAEHHVITAPVAALTVSGGTLSMQFTTYAIRGSAEPAAGWPAGTAGAQGSITPYETGYYAATFVGAHGAWSISRLDIQSDLPVVIPAH